jgi:hypothetical protein
MDIKEHVMRGRTTIEAAQEWPVDRQKYLNASEAGQCIRRLWYSKHTPEAAEPQEWGYARRGSHGEKYVVESLAVLNDVSVDNTGVGQLSLQDETRLLSATPDGLIAIGSGPWMGLEIKTIDPRTNKSRLPKSDHVLQLKIAMALQNQQRAEKLERGLLVYMDASNYDDILTYVIDADDAAVLTEMDKKAHRIFRTKNVDVLDRGGKARGRQ